MKKQQRGSEKLFANCSGAETLSQDELQKVAGGALPTINGVWRIFPRGIVWPELIYGGPDLHLKQELDLGVVNGIDEKLKQPGLLNKR